MSKNKTKRNFWVVGLWAVGIILICSVLVIWISGYGYIYKTLIYTYPGIDDLNIFDTRIVHDGNPQPWPESFSYNKIKLTGDLEKELARNETVAFLVVKNDSIVHEQYSDNFKSNSLVNSFSVSKSIVGVLTGIAIRDGLFNLDDAVGMYIPEFKTGENSKLKIRHVITMSSGLNWDESYSSLFSMTTEAYYGLELKKLILNLKVIEEPGKIFPVYELQYCSACDNNFHNIRNVNFRLCF